MNKVTKEIINEEKNQFLLEQIKEKLVDNKKLEEIIFSIREMVEDMKIRSKNNNLNSMFLMECNFVNYYDYLEVIHMCETHNDCYLKRIDNFPRRFLTRAMRLMKLINIKSPDIIINHEIELLAKSMYEHNFLYLGIDEF